MHDGEITTVTRPLDLVEDDRPMKRVKTKRSKSKSNDKRQSDRMHLMTEGVIMAVSKRMQTLKMVKSTIFVEGSRLFLWGLLSCFRKSS